MRREHDVRYLVDAGKVGSVACYLNHSCDVRMHSPRSAGPAHKGQHITHTQTVYVLLPAWHQPSM